MLHDTELLQYVYKTADMGCQGIQSVLGHVQNAPLKDRLEDQEREYQKLRSEAQHLLKTRGEQAGGIGPVAKASATLMSAAKRMVDPSDSKIAEMAIEGNQMGINKTAKHLNDYQGEAGDARTLAEKLLATEEQNAEQLKHFL